MTAGRYFLAIDVDDDRRAVVRAAAATDRSLSIGIDRPGLIAIIGDNLPVVDLAQHGLILGSLHTAGQRAAVTSLGRDTIATIAATRGDHLVRAYWGDYVALLPSSSGLATDIIRSPLGALPCFHHRTGDTSLIGSDVDLFVRLGNYHPSLDWNALLRFAIAPDVREQATCLAALDELRGGERLTREGQEQSITTLWSPWTFAGRDRQLDDRREAAQRLHGVIVSSLGSQLHPGGRSLVMLSGGLDSSIVSASVATLGLDAQCLTVSTNAASGDERMFARRTAEHLGLPLLEARFDLDAVDLERSGAVRLPRPVARAFEFEARRQARLAAAEIGADRILSGGGGDNIFCSLQSVAPAVDALDGFDDRRAFWKVTRELSHMTGASLTKVAWRAWRRSWQTGRQYPEPVDTLFLAPAAGEIAAIMPRHPWLERPHAVAQGKGAHVAALLGVQTLTGDRDGQDPLALRFPLLAQPIVETCLRIPTWLWYDRGCNRAVARHAFASALPTDIAWRRSKGTPDGFVVELFDARRAQIRDMLFDGNLARQGLVDRKALAPILDDPRPVRGTDHGRVMRLVDIEAWSRSWPG